MSPWNITFHTTQIPSDGHMRMSISRIMGRPYPVTYTKERQLYPATDSNVMIRKPCHVSFGENSIYSSCKAPELAKDIHLYRAEPPDIYSIVTIINAIVTFQGISNDSTNVSCGEQDYLHKLMDLQPTYSSQLNQMYLLGSICFKVDRSPINFRWRHVKGQRDDHMPR